MRKYYVILILMQIINVGCQAQDTIFFGLLGKAQDMLEPTRIFAHIIFSETGGSCGPGKRYESVDDQVENFLINLKESGGMVSPIEFVDHYTSGTRGTRIREIKMPCTSHEESQLIFASARFSFAEGVEFYYELEPFNAEGERRLVVEAVQDAYARAGFLQETLGKSHLRLVSISEQNSSFEDFYADWQDAYESTYEYDVDDWIVEYEAWFRFAAF